MTAAEREPNPLVYANADAVAANQGARRVWAAVVLTAAGVLAATWLGLVMLSS